MPGILQPGWLFLLRGISYPKRCLGR